MKNILLLAAVPVLLVSCGVGQSPSGKTTTTATTTEQASIQGCLAGSAGNYTVTQDGSPQSFKITTSTVNLKPHVGHDVELTGKRVSAPGFGVTDSTLAVTAVKMIADHCATAASVSTAADPATATVTSPAATVSANGSAGTPAAADPATAVVATQPAAAPAPTTTAGPAATDSAAVTPPSAAAPALASSPAAAESSPPAPAATTSATVADKAHPEPATTPVLASDSAPLPNTPAPATKATKVTGKLGADGKTFVSDSDGKSWTVANPDAVKGHEGHHVVLTAHVDADTSQLNVVSLKMAK